MYCFMLYDPVMLKFFEMGYLRLYLDYLPNCFFLLDKKKWAFITAIYVAPS